MICVAESVLWRRTLYAMRGISYMLSHIVFASSIPDTIRKAVSNKDEETVAMALLMQSPCRYV